MIVPLYDVEKKEYFKDEHFSWWQLGGFSLLFLGVIFYNELVEIPFWGFNLNTKEAIARREELEETRTRYVIKNDGDKWNNESEIYENEWIPNP